MKSWALGVCIIRYARFAICALLGFCQIVCSCFLVGLRGGQGSARDERNFNDLNAHGTPQQATRHPVSFELFCEQCSLWSAFKLVMIALLAFLYFMRTSSSGFALAPCLSLARLPRVAKLRTGAFTLLVDCDHTTRVLFGKALLVVHRLFATIYRCTNVKRCLATLSAFS